MNTSSKELIHLTSRVLKILVLFLSSE